MGLVKTAPVVRLLPWKTNVAGHYNGCAAAAITKINPIIGEFMCHISNRICAVMLVLMTPLIVSSSIRAQDKEGRVRVDTDLAVVNVLVVDKVGKPVRGLTARQFELFDDGVQRPIENFSAGEAPVSFGIVYDMHPTTEERTRSIIESLRQFKNELGTGDDLFLVAFDMRGLQTFDFIPTVDQLERHMAGPDKSEPRSLYDGVYFASDRIRKSRNQKRVLVIISDGADHNSRHTFSDLSEKVSDVKADVYALIFDENNEPGFTDLTHKGTQRRPFSGDASALDRAALHGLTLDRGGSTYFGSSASALRLQTIYKEIASEMREHYALGFYPELIDNKRHTIRIGLRGVQGAKDLVLTYPPTYRIRVRPLKQ